MVKHIFVFAFAAVLVGVTGWFAWQRVESNINATIASVGLDVGESQTPTPKLEVGDLAMQGLGALATPSVSSTPQEDHPARTLEGGVQMKDNQIGSGAEAVAGSRVLVHYTGMLQDGTVFDSSRDRDPFEFTLGSGDVIKGWDIGVAGMRVGGTRSLAIPPALAYGAQGMGDAIPPNAPLCFDVELLAVQ